MNAIITGLLAVLSATVFLVTTLLVALFMLIYVAVAAAVACVRWALGARRRHRDAVATATV